MAQIELNYKRKKSSTTETQIDLMNLKGKLRFPKLSIYSVSIKYVVFEQTFGKKFRQNGSNIYPKLPKECYLYASRISLYSILKVTN